MTNNIDGEKRVYFGVQIQPLRSNIATIHRILIMSVTQQVIKSNRKKQLLFIVFKGEVL